jgi:hypothetical protein
MEVMEALSVFFNNRISQIVEFLFKSVCSLVRVNELLSNSKPEVNAAMPSLVEGDSDSSGEAKIKKFG